MQSVDDKFLVNQLKAQEEELSTFTHVMSILAAQGCEQMAALFLWGKHFGQMLEVLSQVLGKVLNMEKKTLTSYNPRAVVR